MNINLIPHVKNWCMYALVLDEFDKKILINIMNVPKERVYYAPVLRMFYMHAHTFRPFDMHSLRHIYLSKWIEE